jgi:hypothetical protein
MLWLTLMGPEGDLYQVGGFLEERLAIERAEKEFARGLGFRSAYLTDCLGRVQKVLTPGDEKKAGTG